MFGFRKYSASELQEFARSCEPKSINAILDQETVDFLLGIRISSDTFEAERIDSVAEDIEEHVLQTLGELVVAESRFTDGQLRLETVKALGYPESLCATIHFEKEY